MNIILSSLLLFVAATASFPPPLEQSVEEITSILTDKRLSRFISETESIMTIRALHNAYLILTEEAQMIIDVEYGPQGSFKLIFNAPTKRTEPLEL